MGLGCPKIYHEVATRLREPAGTDRIVALAGRKNFAVDPEDFLHSGQFIANNREKQLTATEIRYRIY